MNKKVEKYPCYRYHDDHKAVICKNEAEEEALGKGWVKTPADLKPVVKLDLGDGHSEELINKLAEAEKSLSEYKSSAEETIAEANQKAEENLKQAVAFEKVSISAMDKLGKVKGELETVEAKIKDLEKQLKTVKKGK